MQKYIEYQLLEIGPLNDLIEFKIIYLCIAVVIWFN